MSLILKQEAANTVPTPAAGKGTIFLDDNDQIAVKTSGGNTSVFPAVTTSNTQVFYNDQGSLAGSNAFVFNDTSNTVTVANLTVTDTLIAGDIAVSSIANGTSNVDIVGVSGNVTISVAGNANILTATGTGVNVAGTLNSTGNANVGNIGATGGVFTTVAGSLTTASQPNVTSVGTLTSLGVNGTITGVNITANTGVFTGNGSGLTNIAGANVTGAVSYATTANAVAGANVSGAVAYATTANSVAGANVSGAVSYATTANSVAGANVSGAVGLATYASTANAIAGANVSGEVGFAAVANSVAGANVSGQVNYAATANAVAGANVSGQVGNSLVAGTVYTAAQPNITSVGTLTSVDVTGNTVSGNVYANSGTIGASLLTGTLTTASQPNITSTGTLTSLSVTGTASAGNLITGGTLSVTGNANVGNMGAAAGVFTANVSANNLSTTNKVTAGNGLQVTTGALTILSGNLDITGNLNVTGNVNYSNVTDLVVGDPLIYIGEDNSGDTVDLGIVASYNNGSYVHTGLARNAATDYWTFFDGVAAEPTTVIDWANATYPTVKMGALLSTSTVTGTRLISNIATGTAPLVVSSTTQVANLNAATAGLATYATTANAVAGANVSGAVAYATTANAVAGANVSGAVGLATYATTANSVAGANVSGAVAYATTANSVAGANVSGAVSYATTANAVAGANVSGTVSSATTAGTVTTAAQPNITSTGTLTGLSMGGTLLFNNSTSPNTNTIQFGDNTGWYLRFMTNVSGTPTQRFSFSDQGVFAAVSSVSSPTAVHSTSVQTPLLTTGANTTAGTITGNWSLSSGSKMQATYADLAEKYVADTDYEPGTVLVFGGEHEVTISTELNTTRVAGVVTTNAAYSMNSALEAEHVAEIALQGRVPVKVIGPVFKGDLLVSAGNGHAIANNEARAGTIIGKSLENFTDATGVIEVAVGRF
jgi:hypothetical protein